MTETDVLAQWHNEGVLHIRSALDPQECQALRAATDGALLQPGARSRAGSDFTDDGPTLRLQNAISHTDQLDSLIDHPSVFGHLLSLAGSHLALLGSEIYSRAAAEDWIHELHMDGGPGMWGVGMSKGATCLALKVQFFLTDLSEANSGNFAFLPGSHYQRLPYTEDGTLTGPRAAETPKQILAEAGDAIIFPWCLWHCVAPNTSGRSRRSVILRYGQLWARPNDRFALQEGTAERLNDRQRRVCGVFDADAQPWAWYFPPSQQELVARPT